MGSNTRFASVRTAAVAAVLLLSGTSIRAQDPEGQRQSAAQPEMQPPSQQDRADSRPVISRDRFPEDQQPPASPAERPSAPGRAPTRRTPPAPVPANLVIPPGTVIFARLAKPLSSDRNQPGDTFTATLDRPIIVNGWVVARRGETVLGTVTAAEKAGRVKGVSQLGLELTDMTVVDGQQLPVLTELWKGSAGTSHGADAAGIATTTGVGTIIGAAANGGEGAGIGAGAGAVAGIALVLLTRGKPTVIGPEALLTFQLKDPVTANTTNSQQAFQPVRPNDYGPPLQ